MMGQDIGILGGAYGVTGDLYHKYGPDRVIDAPLSENAIVGFGIGAAIRGWRPIIDIMKMDFSMCALDPVSYTHLRIHQKEALTFRNFIGTKARCGNLLHRVYLF